MPLTPTTSTTTPHPKTTRPGPGHGDLLMTLQYCAIRRRFLALGNREAAAAADDAAEDKPTKTTDSTKASEVATTTTTRNAETFDFSQYLYLRMASDTCYFYTCLPSGWRPVHTGQPVKRM